VDEEDLCCQRGRPAIRISFAGSSYRFPLHPWLCDQFITLLSAAQNDESINDSVQRRIMLNASVPANLKEATHHSTLVPAIGYGRGERVVYHLGVRSSPKDEGSSCRSVGISHVLNANSVNFDGAGDIDRLLMLSPIDVVAAIPDGSRLTPTSLPEIPTILGSQPRIKFTDLDKAQTMNHGSRICSLKHRGHFDFTPRCRCIRVCDTRTAGSMDKVLLLDVGVGS